MVWVNGEPRAGDPYSYGYVHVPVQIKKGANLFLFTVARGDLKTKLTASPGEIFFNPGDITTPDLLTGRKYDGWAAVPVINATPAWQKGVTIVSTLPGSTPTRTELPELPPFSVSKVPIRIAGMPPAKPGPLSVTLALQRPKPDAGRSLDQTVIRLRVLKPEQTHKVTFRSKIDGSVQYYALVPATPGPQTPGLILTLHGAGVEGLGQADCFKPKPWTHVVAATNRRPYGFDWEDWGRLDALEVLDEASHTLKVDPHRIWLTGHSMGGHGTWHLGVTFPDKFAAIGPSAGWISMMSYAGVPRHRTPGPDGRPVSTGRVGQRHAGPRQESRLARRVHAARRPGRQCARRPGPRDAQSARRLPRRLGLPRAPGGRPLVGQPVRRLAADVRSSSPSDRGPTTRTSNGSTSSRSARAFRPTPTGRSSKQQQKAFKPSSVHLSQDPDKRRFAGTTENVACLGLDVTTSSRPGQYRSNSTAKNSATCAWPAERCENLALSHGRQVARGRRTAAATAKSPVRSGPFRDAFRNRHAVRHRHARHAGRKCLGACRKPASTPESFWYRGNGLFEIVPDTDFNPAKDRDRNVDPLWQCRHEFGLDTPLGRKSRASPIGRRTRWADRRSRATTSAASSSAAAGQRRGRRRRRGWHGRQRHAADRSAARISSPASGIPIAC